MTPPGRVASFKNPRHIPIGFGEVPRVINRRELVGDSKRVHLARFKASTGRVLSKIQNNCSRPGRTDRPVAMQTSRKLLSRLAPGQRDSCVQTA